ncbi:hypothetical protein M8J76_002157 [Diaphorina citri]|nr:hypothetical protein M8J76_002157 [Diaphorina citri]
MRRHETGSLFFIRRQIPRCHGNQNIALVQPSKQILEHGVCVKILVVRSDCEPLRYPARESVKVYVLKQKAID